MAVQPFENIPDLAFAEALSDTVTAPENYTYLTSKNVADTYGTGFPPVPTELLSVIGAYVEVSDSEPGSHVHYAELSPRMPDRSVIADAYEETVGNLHVGLLKSNMSLNIIPTFYEAGGAVAWSYDLARRNNCRLLAAHFVGRVVADEQIIDGFAYPKAVKNELPLIVREFALTARGLLQGGETESVRAVERKLNLQSLLQNSEQSQILGAMAMSSFLPDPAIHRRVITSAP